MVSWWMVVGCGELVVDGGGLWIDHFCFSILKKSI